MRIVDLGNGIAVNADAVICICTKRMLGPQMEQEDPETKTFLSLINGQMLCVTNSFEDVIEKMEDEKWKV